MKLSEAELEAIEWLKYEGGSMLVTHIPSKSERGILGETVPGMAIFKKLEKKGLVFFSIEDEEPFADLPGFSFTPEVYLVTDEPESSKSK